MALIKSDLRTGPWARMHGEGRFSIPPWTRDDVRTSPMFHKTDRGPLPMVTGRVNVGSFEQKVVEDEEHEWPPTPTTRPAANALRITPMANAMRYVFLDKFGIFVIECVAARPTRRTKGTNWDVIER